MTTEDQIAELVDDLKARIIARSHRLMAKFRCMSVPLEEALGLYRAIGRECADYAIESLGLRGISPTQQTPDEAAVFKTPK